MFTYIQGVNQIIDTTYKHGINKWEFFNQLNCELSEELERVMTI